MLPFAKFYSMVVLSMVDYFLKKSHLFDARKSDLY